MKIAIFGNKTSTTRLLNKLIETGISVHTVITLNNDKKLAHNISGVDLEIDEICKKLNVNILRVSKYTLSDPHYSHMFKELDFDVGLCTGWQRIIPQSILDSFKHGVFGWHGSAFQFPNGRGRSPINWSIRLGFNVIYHNCFKYSSGVDNGSIFDTKEISFGKGDYIADVQKLALLHIFESSIKLISDIRNSILTLTRQPESTYICLPKLSEVDGLLQPKRMTVDQAVNITRSCSKPFPGAIIKLNCGRRVKVWRLEAYAQPLAIKSEKLVCFDDDILYVRFIDGIAKSTHFTIEKNNSDATHASKEPA